MRDRSTARCPLCATVHPVSRLSAATWLAPDVSDEIRERFPNWSAEQGACPNCARLQIQRALTEQSLKPVATARAPAWQCLPTPFRTGGDPRFTGVGVTLAMIDAAFYPHPDLVRPRNRIRAWIDATGPRVRSVAFAPDETPRWPGWDKIAAPQWHGLMASGIAAGNGRLSHGLYRGLASEADLILVQTMDARHRITNATLARALRWLRRYGPALGLRVINFSVAGDPIDSAATSAVDVECAKLIANGVTCVAAVGNSNRHQLVTPSTHPGVIAVGGIDDHDRISPDVWTLWHSNWGEASDGSLKPDLVAPSWRVVAPLLPKSSVANEAKELFARRLLGDLSSENRINDQKLVTPYYQHMDGTSVAAPIVSGTVACMLQANPSLAPERIVAILRSTAERIGGPAHKQGAGVVRSGAAVAAALADRFAHPSKPIRRLKGRGRN